MQVYLENTQQIKRLPDVIDYKNNTSSTVAFINNADGIGRTAKETTYKFVSINYLDVSKYEIPDGVHIDYVTSSANFDWWETIINNTNKAEKYIFQYPRLITLQVRYELDRAYNLQDIDEVAKARLAIIERVLDEAGYTSEQSK